MLAFMVMEQQIIFNTFLFVRIKNASIFDGDILFVYDESELSISEINEYIEKRAIGSD